MTELEAVQLAKQNYPTGFEFLYRQHYQFVENLCLGVVRNRSDAQDLAQETFLKVQTRISQFKGASTFRTWLFRLAMNECRMELRRRKQRPEAELDCVPQKTEVLSEASLVSGEILQDLPPQQRGLFSRYVLEGFTSRELAEQEGIPVATLKSQLFRIRTKLRKELR